MNKFQKTSLIGGWVVFAIALLTYTLTLEPTTSLWDCGEFIATSYKLEVGHPPGTPFFFLINRLGAMFAADPANVAYAVNFLSGLESALTIAFMFWSIVMLGRMMYKRRNQVLTDSQEWGVLIGAAIGSLVYTFTDTFWFSAVEAEVYALSSLFTAVVFWMILKWETKAEQPSSNRWLILIAYVMGLSIGAHILNLLTIPALVFVYYFKKFPQRDKKQLWKPAAVGVILTGAFYMLTPTVVSIGAFVDRIFVNSLSLGVNSGLACFVLAVLVGFVYMAWWAQKRGRALLNTIMLAGAMIVIGFSSYGIVLIRSSVNPPMNSNDPSNPYALLSFLNREQYGSRPLMYGQTYNSPVIGYDYETDYIVGEDGKYKPYKKNTKAQFDPATEMLFPRMYNAYGGQNHKNEYEKWGDVKGKKIRSPYEEELITVPTQGENIRYFFTYQLNHMYWRYFMWNFVGRQSDIQSYGNIDNGMWMSGIPFIDEAFLGPQDNLPDGIASNKGRNTYFFLPLILGLIGLFFHLNRDGRGFLVVTLLFFMTGLAIILYLNQTPLQPRERDYAYAASFYAFAIWIGFGAIAVNDWVNKKLKGEKITALAIASIVCLSVPTVLATQNWDDHDRSERTIARDAGFNYLSSTLPNSVLVNYGDNDTFPVWYAQEVEGFRTDVRPMNQQYLSGGDWYADQMRVKANESQPLPFTIKREKYIGDAIRQFAVKEIPKKSGGYWTGKEVMAFINSDDKITKARYGDNMIDVIPTRTIAIPVNKKNVLKSGIVKPENENLIVDTLFIKIDQGFLNIDQMLMIDLIANADWTRPLHFTNFGELIKFGIVGQEKVLENGKMIEKIYTYLQNDGATYRLVPIKTYQNDFNTVGRVDQDELYDLLFNKFKYGNIAKKHVYVDGFVENTFAAMHLRESFIHLAKSYLEQGDSTKVIQIIDKSIEVMPFDKLKYDDNALQMLELYWLAGDNEKGDELAEKYGDWLEQFVTYYGRFDGKKRELVKSIAMEYLEKLYMLQLMAMDYEREQVASKYEKLFESMKS